MKPRAARNPPKRRREPDPAKTPWQKAHTRHLQMMPAHEAEQSLQCAIEQRGMQQISVECLANRRGVEMDDRGVRGNDLDIIDCSEPTAIIQPSALRQSIKGLRVDSRPVRRAFGPAQNRLSFGRRRDPTDGVNCERLTRQARTASQLPVTVFGDEGRAQFAHPSFIERKRAPHFDIEDFQNRGLRPAPSRCRERGFEYRRSREDRHPLDRVVGDPGQHLLVEMIEPVGYRTALPETEQRVVAGRVFQIAGFYRFVQPEPPSLPWV